MSNKHKRYCCNCGKHGHLYKECRDPITSYGIILIKIPNNEKADQFIDKLKKDMEKTIKDNPIRYNGSNSLKVFCNYANSIRFLMVKRKHSLGYFEFMRGKYDLENIDYIRYLFTQMMKEEIEKIKKSSFEELWKDLWSNNSSSYDNEFERSRKKFNKLKSGTNIWIDFLTTVEPLYEHTEWGFPKGRRNYNESDINCAIREFKEETCYTRDDIILLDSIKPITENLTGSNGKRYRHIYYIAISNSEKHPIIDKTNFHQSSEIGGIGWFTYYEAINKVRDHHRDRKQILTDIHGYIINSISDMTLSE